MIYRNFEWSHSILTVSQQEGWGDSWRIAIVYKDMAYAKQIQRIAESYCAHDGSPTAGYAWASVRTTYDVAERMVAAIDEKVDSAPKPTPTPEPVGQLSFI